MLTYNTGVQAYQPIPQAMQQKATQGIMAYAPTHGDVYAGEAQKQAVDYERSSAAANNDFMQQSQQARINTALQGLQNASQAQQNATDIESKRQKLQMGYVGNMFGGLNSLLSGLYL